MGVRAAAILAGATLLVGCNSISSTMLNRLETDDFVANSNGERKAHCEARPYKGVPITLRVPTHVDVSIEEKIRFCLNGNTLTPLQSTRRHLSVDTELIYTDKVFTVDVKRPAAGTADYTMEFGGNGTDLDNRQYFKNIKSKIVDETIKDVTAAINTVFSAVPSSKEGDGDDAVEAESGLVFFDQTRTVAWKRFDVDMVDFEIQVADFVAKHLNNCNSCCDYRAGESVTLPLQPENVHSAIGVPVESPVELLTPLGFRDEETPE